MKKIMLIVAYDGTGYHGWQIQPNGITIESELNRHLSDLFHEEIQVVGASRTDAGVHASGNAAVFTTNARMPAEKVSYALNQRLPEDIRIQDSFEVALQFHPRHCESLKTYEYVIWNARFPNPLERLYSHFTYRKLDEKKMERAASYLVGEHDFKSFCSTKTEAESTVRTIYSLKVAKTGNRLVITVTGNGFLYNMVRIIAGTLIEVGSGCMEPEALPQILEAKSRESAGPTAPAKGLRLVKIEYPCL